MERCKTCIHFQAEDYPYRGWGSCTQMWDDYITNITADGPGDGRLVIPWDYEGYSAGAYISPEFGCVLHES